jgi:hypothetical protein
MASAPASSRLTILSLKLTGIINAVWTILVISVGTGLIRGAAAIDATAIFLVTHTVSAILVLVALKHLNEAPKGLFRLSLISLIGTIVMAVLAWLRWLRPSETVQLSAAILTVTLALVASTLHLGSKFAGPLDILSWWRIRGMSAAPFGRSNLYASAGATASHDSD